MTGVMAGTVIIISWNIRGMIREIIQISVNYLNLKVSKKENYLIKRRR
jgi:hypothetical protein